MSTTIDQRVVEMRFDNKQFESNVSTTMSTLEKLKSKLNFTNSAKGLGAIGDYIKKIDFSGISSGVDVVQAKFSALEVIGVTALANITNSAVNAGKRMLNALTIDPISTGFSEYELKMGSVQTIMAGTGEKLEVINKYLEELNAYSDRTIYSFSDMTSSIGKFTNAGVNLKDAVKAIQGVSNVAAISGANADEASRAMYNFAQALSVGSVKLIDWKSIENANMATVAFKDELIKTATEMGTLVKVGEQYKTTTTDMNGKVSDLFTSTKGFNDSLSNQWMTSEVLIKTLNKYSDETTELGKKAFQAATEVKTFSEMCDSLKEAAQSGWAATWETIFGDYTEGVKLWTGIYNTVSSVIDASSNARNEILKVWKEFGGRAAIVEALSNAFNALANVLSAVKTAYREIFPRMDGKQLATLSKRIEIVTKGFEELTKRNMPKVQKTFEAFFAVIKGITTVIGTGLKIAIKAAVVVITVLAQIIFDISDKLSVVILAFRKWATENEILKKSLSVVVGILTVFISKVISVGSAIISGFLDAISIVVTLVEEFFQLEIVQNILSAFASVVSTVFANIKQFLTAGIYIIREFINTIRNLDEISLKNVSEVFKDFGSKIKEHFEGIDEMFGNISDATGKFKDTVKDSFETTGGTVDGLQTKFQRFAKVVSNALYSIGPAEVFAVGFGVALIWFLRKINIAINNVTKPIASFSGIMGSLSQVLKSFAFSVKASALTSAALAIAILAGSLIILSKAINKKDMLVAALVLGTLGAALAAFTKYVSSFGNIDKFVVTMLSFAGGLLILTACMKIIEGIDSAKIGQSFTGLIGIMVVMAAFAVLLAKYAPALSANSIFLVSFSASVLLMVYALDKLTTVDMEAVRNSLDTFGTILVTLGAISWMMGNLTLGSAAGVLLLSAGIVAFLHSLDYICNYDFNLTLGALGKLTLVFGTLAGAFAATKLAGKYAADAGVMLLGMGVGLRLMGSTLKILADFDIPSLIKSVAGASALIYAMKFLIEATSKAGEHAAKAGATLIQMGAAMVILAAVVTIMAHIDFFGIVKAVAAIVVIMDAMSGLVRATEKAKDIKATLVIIALIIAELVASIGVLAMLDPQQLVLATATVTGIIGVFTLLIKALDTVSNAGNLVKNAASAAVSMGMFLGVIGLLLVTIDKLEVSASIETVGSICLLLLSMTAATAIMSAMGPLANGAFAGASAMLKALFPVAAVIGMIGFIAGLLGEILPEGAESAIDRGLSIIQKVVNGIVETLAGIVTTALTSLTAGLVEVGNNLSAFGESLSGFIESVRLIDDKALTGTGYLTGILLELTGGGFLTRLGGLESTLSSMAGMDFTGLTNTVESVSSMGKKMSKLEKVKEWFDNNDIRSFGFQLKTFAEAFSNYAEAVPANGAEAATAMTEIASSFTALDKMISSSKNLFSGEVNLSTFGEQLVKFSETLKTFYGNIKGINAEQLTGVLSGVNQLTSAVKQIGKLDPGTVSSFKVTFSNMASQAIQAFIDTIRNSTPQVRASMNNLVFAINAGLSSNSIMFKMAGQTVISNLILGMNAMSGNAKEAMHKLSRTAWFETTKFYNNYYSTGQYLIKGFISGMKSKKGDVKKVGKELGKTALDSLDKTLDIHSPSREAFVRGLQTVKGYVNGAKSKFGELKNTVSGGMKDNVLGTLDGFKSTIQKKGADATSAFGDSMLSSLYDYVPELKTMFGDISLDFNDGSISDIADSLGANLISNKASTEGVTSAMNNVSNATKSATSGLGGYSSSAKSAKKSTDILAEALGNLSKNKKTDTKKTYEAVTALQKYMQQRYKESEQYETDTETLKKYQAELEELAKKRDIIKKKAEDSVKGRIKLSEDEKKQVKSDLEEIEKSVESKTEEIEKHLETMCTNAKKIYTDLRDNVKKTFEEGLDFSKIKLDTGIDLFKEFKLDEEVTPKSILDNMKSQVKGVEKMMKSLDKLSQKESLSSGLLDKLKEMGASGASYIDAFSKMTSQQLSRASEYFEKTGTLSGKKLLDGMKDSFTNLEKWQSDIGTLLTTGLDQRIIEKLASMGTSSQEYLNAFMTFTPEDIEAFNQMYVSALKLPNDATDDIMKSFVDTWNRAANASVGIDATNSAALVEGATELGVSMTGGLEQGIENKKETLLEKAGNVAIQTLEKFGEKLSHKNGSEIGEDVTAGLESGIRSGKSGVIYAAVDVALEAYKAAKKALDINSPSGMFESLGVWSDAGLAKGLIKNTHVVVSAVKDVAGDALSGMKKAMSKIATAVDGDFDIKPIICPIVDLTNVEESAALIGSLLSGNQTSGLAVSTQRSVNNSLAAKQTASSERNRQNGETIINNFEQNNYSPKALSRGEIYRQTKNLFSAAKGTVKGV